MSAVWVRARAELRSRWRAWLALAIVFGIAAGASMAAAAGARRSESAYPRFVEQYESYDVVLGGIATEDPKEVERIRQQIIAMPEVAEYGVGQFVSAAGVLPSGVTVSFPELFLIGDAGGHDLLTVNRAKVLSGRMFTFDATDEAVLSFTAADRLHLRVGDSIGVVLGDPAHPKTVPIRIVGIVAMPGGMPAVGQADLTGIQVSPGFIRANADEIPPSTDAPSIRLKPGASLDAFLARVEKLSSGVDVPVTLPLHVRGVQRTLRFEVQALWILAALIALAATAILGQAIARQITAESGDHRKLLALGMSPRQLIAIGMLRAAVIAIVAALTSVVVAIAASPLTPIGLSRMVEPDPGVHVDSFVTLLGVALTLSLVIMIAAIPTLRGAIQAARAATEQAKRPSRLAETAGAVGAGPSVVTGLRLALEAGRGARAVPIRSALFGLSLAVAAFVAAGTFTSSLDHLIATPSLYGFDWDFITTAERTPVRPVIARDPDVEAYAAGGALNIVIGTKRLIPFTYEEGRGIEPTILEGRAPHAPDEIALGTVLLRRQHKRIGDTVEVSLDTEEGPKTRPLPMKIVGRCVVPSFFFEAVEPGESAAMTLAASERLDPGIHRSVEQLPVIVRYKPGVDLDRKLEALREDVPDLFTFQVRRPGADIAAVSRSSGVPVLLTQVMLLMALATLVHVLVTSVRKRKHDLAVLKTLGFVRRQVATAVAWQATTLTVISLAVGIPVGIALGRWTWKLFASTLGVVPSPQAPVSVVAILAPGALLLANVIASFPARTAARTQPASVLKVE